MGHGDPGAHTTKREVNQGQPHWQQRPALQAVRGGEPLLDREHHTLPEIPNGAKVAGKVSRSTGGESTLVSQVLQPSSPTNNLRNQALGLRVRCDISKQLLT